MKVSIVVPDNKVYIDGSVVEMDLSELAGIHAAQIAAAGYLSGGFLSDILKD